MSYDIFFWREKPGAALDPGLVLRLEDTQEMPGLIPIPRDYVLAAFREQFPDASIGSVELEWEGDGSYFQVGFTHFDETQISLASINCGFDLLKSASAMRRLATVASSLDCRLYDPQTP